MPVTVVPRPLEQPHTTQPLLAEVCAGCSNPEHNPFIIDPESRLWEVGDIVVIRESIHAPIDQLLDNRRSTSRHCSNGPSSEGGGTRGKNRSAIVWDIVPPQQTREEKDPPYLATYILMASYEGCERYDQLPTILKDYFVLCVSPHIEIRPGDSHVHTTPEWQARCIWLVAIAFMSDGYVIQRWRWKNAQRVREDDKGFRVEDAAQSQLEDTMEARLMKWNAACLDQPSLLDQCKAEYNVRFSQLQEVICILTWDQIFKTPEKWRLHLSQQAQKVRGETYERSSRTFTENLQESEAAAEKDIPPATENAVRSLEQVS